MATSTPSRGRDRRVGLWLVLLLGGCAREPLPEYCPVVEPGDLVISELRGAQAATDSFGHYVEIYNAGGATVDLEGLVLRLRSSGGDELQLFVRESLKVGAGEYVVIGPGDPAAPAGWIDYAIGWDISGGDPTELRYPDELLRYAGAFVELEACGELIDEVFYDNEQLTKTGTLACGNADAPPSAADNDLIDLDGGSCWCVDAGEADPDQPLFGVGLPGTPGRANRCP